MRIIPQGDSAWFCADKSVGVRVDWVGVRVRWGMYDVRVCVAAKVRMIPILYCHRGRG